MKKGLDYFPVDIQNDDKLNLIEAEFGLIGWAVVMRMYRRIYSLGYYTKWSKDEQLLFSKEINVDISDINVIISRAIERNLFNNAVFQEYGILTSKGIQKRYEKITERRKYSQIAEKYRVKSDNENQDVSITDKNVNISSENENISKQSKVKESKEKKRKSIYAGNSKNSQPPKWAMELSEFIFSKSKIKPTKNQVETGAETIEKIHRIDKVPEDEIKSIIHFAFDDDFWNDKVQSPATLREKRKGSGDLMKYQKIKLQMDRNNEKNQKWWE